MINLLLTGANQGLMWAILALGVYISFRLLNFADLTCEGSITFGASISALMIWWGVDPFLSLLIAFLGGCLAGLVTGLLSTKLKIPPILAGILTMTSLYSINLHVMSAATGAKGTANLSLLGFDTIFKKLGSLLGLPSKPFPALIFGIVTSLFIICALYWFFGTELGCAIRATGSNENMCRAQGIDTDLTKICGLAISNGLIALAGGVICQYQGFSDVKMGIGSIVIGLASIIIGETIFMRAKNFFLKMLGIIVGAVIYQVIIAFIFKTDIDTNNLKLMSALIITVALSLPVIKNALLKPRRKSGSEKGGN